MTSIGLCMIARNETHVLRRCLDSALPLLDYILIVDTGSEDGTQELVRTYLKEKNVAGEVIEEPWRDFAYNRNIALKKLREKNGIDYSLMLDADQVVLLDPHCDVSGFKASLIHDIYDVKVHVENVEYLLPKLSRNRLEIIYRGIVHEFRECSSDCTRSTAIGFCIREIHDGNRSRDIKKYENDAAILEQALLNEADPFLIARYKFYLAQSYRDCGRAERAIQLYLECAELGFWDEEVFINFYYAAKLKEQFEAAPDEIIELYLRAHRACARRAEALHAAARLCRAVGNHKRGYDLVKQAAHIPYPQRGLFVEKWIYEYGILDELSVLAYWSGHYRESLDACLQLLEQGSIPDEQRDRVRQNAHHALGKLPAIRQGDMVQQRPPVESHGRSSTTSAMISKSDVRRLNVGCGRNALAGWINLDIAKMPGVDIVADIEKCAFAPLPFESDSIDEFLLSHVIEHIHASLDLMQELYRVAKPNAKATIRVPFGGSDDAWEDPTHVRAYFTNSFGYFSQPFYWRADYGYRGDWQPYRIVFLVEERSHKEMTPQAILDKIYTQRNVVREMIAELTAIKPARQPVRELQVGPTIEVEFA
jgi:glycosyltransferase involved in cell wall biosynthesis/SAM-dependent methyltransferase